MTATIETLNLGKTKHSDLNLDELVGALRQSREKLHNIRINGRIRELPSREAVSSFIDSLKAALFPTHFRPASASDEYIDFFVKLSLQEVLRVLTEQVRRSLQFDLPDLTSAAELKRNASEISTQFIKQVATLRGQIVGDLQAAFRGDPAASSYSEILLCYRGMSAIIHHRIAHILYNLGARFIARLIADLAHEASGIDIHPGAAIGENFFIDHGTGVVIGQTAIIGNNVRLYQAVTLGAVRFPAEADGSLTKGQPRHPIIEDNVVIYAGATILGRITIGHDSIIGGNVWLTQSVPPHSSITQARNQNS